MKRELWRFVGLLAISFAVLVFQNCGPTAAVVPGTGANTAAATSSSEGSGLILDVGFNPQTVSVPHGSSAFDVGGNCDTGGYASHLHWTLTNAQGSTNSSGVDTIGCTALDRWRLFVTIQGAGGGVQYTLTVTMTGIDANGNEFTNPQLLNQKTIAVISN